MAWRVFNSLLVLRGQVNALAPNRAKGADGTICDTNHPTTSDHCPHNVPGVGSEMVSALDLTHDPAGGFDSYRFAEVLRIHRDQRIKYVISDHHMFSSYATSSYAAWTWRPYSGTDPHTNHVHISVLDAAISDTSTPWNLEGFVMALTEADLNAIGLKVWNWDLLNGAPVGVAYEQVLAILAQVKLNGGSLSSVLDGQKRIEARLAAMDDKIDQILLLLKAGGGTLPTASSFTVSSFDGTITWNIPE
jgi:hypothetical protein